MSSASKKNLTTKPLPLERMLFSQGFGTRKECQTLCWQERVAVQGEVIDDPHVKIAVHDGLLFTVDGKTWPYHAKAYIALHKPAGYECSHKPGFYPSVYTLLPSPLRMRQVQAAGRLDADTTGLLLLSDDGQFIHQATSGKKSTPKIYIITTKHLVNEQMQSQLLQGVQLDDEPGPIAATECILLDTHCLSLTITTGKYHQVKRMVAAVGNRVEALHRQSVGKLVLPQDLQEGQWQWISAEDVL